MCPPKLQRRSPAPGASHRLRSLLPGAVLALCCGFWAGVVTAAEPPDGFRLCVDPEWPPYEVINPQGEHEGIAADLIRLALSRAGVRLPLYPTQSWDETMQAIKRGECQVLSFVNQTPARSEWLIFTEPLFTDKNVLIAREGHPAVIDLGDYPNAVIAVPAETATAERLQADFPNQPLLLTRDEFEAFRAVSEGRARFTLRALTVAVHNIKQEGWFDLAVVGHLPRYDNQLRLAVLKDYPALRDALNVGVTQISEAERREIANRHVAITVQSAIDYTLLWQVLAGALLVIGTSLFWVARLSQLNRRLDRVSRTDRLTGLRNRGDIDQALTHAFDTQRRQGGPLAVILFDLDHFKRVNDQLGHQAGDAVLREFSSLLEQLVRGTDRVGRWGGEEFLAVCPGTDASGALQLAERVVIATRNHSFSTGHQQTVSAGVAELMPNEALDTLLSRTDQHLYAAKNAGRDRASAAMTGSEVSDPS